MQTSRFTGALVAAALFLGGAALRAQAPEDDPPAKAGDEERKHSGAGENQNGNPGEHRRDAKERQKDRREIRKDRREVREDRRELRGDRKRLEALKPRVQEYRKLEAKLAKAKKEGADPAKVRALEEKCARMRESLRKEGIENPGDVKEDRKDRRKDRRDFRDDHRDKRKDRREELKDDRDGPEPAVEAGDGEKGGANDPAPDGSRPKGGRRAGKR